jgi:hypothetical protein
LEHARNELLHALAASRLAARNSHDERAAGCQVEKDVAEQTAATQPTRVVSNDVKWSVCG